MTAKRSRISGVICRTKCVLRHGFDRRRNGKSRNLRLPSRFRFTRKGNRKLRRPMQFWAWRVVNRLLGFTRKCAVSIWIWFKSLLSGTPLIASQLLLAFGLAKVLETKSDIPIEIALQISISFLVSYWTARVALAQEKV